VGCLVTAFNPVASYYSTVTLVLQTAAKHNLSTDSRAISDIIPVITSNISGTTTIQYNTTSDNQGFTCEKYVLSAQCRIQNLLLLLCQQIEAKR
jgi:hypothetical protein